MSSLRENYFNVLTEAWPKTSLDTRYRCNLIIPKIFFNDTITLIAKGIKNSFLWDVDEDDGKCKLVTAVANDFLPPADLRESAFVLPDMACEPRHLCGYQTIVYYESSEWNSMVSE